MAAPEIDERLRQLALEAKKLMEENFTKDPSETDGVIARLLEIRQEIRSYGFEMDWQVSFSASNPDKLEAVITILRPKANMTPEEQKIYDEWFRRVNDLDD